MRSLRHESNHSWIAYPAVLKIQHWFTFALLVTSLASLQAATTQASFSLTARTSAWSERILTELGTDAESFVVEVTIDPVAGDEGDLQVVSGLIIGLEDSDSKVSDPVGSLRLHFREGGERAGYDLWHRKVHLNRQIPHPKPAGYAGPDPQYQHPNVLPASHGQGRHFKLLVWPEGKGSRVWLFADTLDRPVEDHVLEERITAGVIKAFTMRGGQEHEITRESQFSDLRLKQVTPKSATELPSIWESVLAALDLSRPELAPVAQAVEEGRLEDAKQLFLRHMRERQAPQGPSMEEAKSTALHPDWQQIADEALQDRYGTVGYFTQFAAEWTDAKGQAHPWVLNKNPLRLNWGRENGHLNRHFHWVSLARTWQETKDPQYATRFSAEVLDWVSREPFY